MLAQTAAQKTKVSHILRKQLSKTNSFSLTSKTNSHLPVYQYVNSVVVTKAFGVRLSYSARVVLRYLACGKL